MRKLSRTILCLLLCFACFAGTVGCGDIESDDVKIDPTRTQLWVSNYNGGMGDAWLYSLFADFEEEYKGESFEAGKTGVQVLLENSKNSGSAVLDDMGKSICDVFFTQFVNYYDMISRDLALDITTAVTTPNSDGKTIVSKFFPEQEAFYNNGGKYYGVPFASGYSGIAYNAGLFKSKGLYLKAGPDGRAYKENGKYVFTPADSTDGRSSGPDGDITTEYDNGLPATFDEFFAVCDRMLIVGVTPFVWSGQYQDSYTAILLAELFANYEGKTQAMLNATFNGTATNLVESISDDGKVTFKKPTAIGASNYADIFKTAGRYYAVEFLDRMLSNNDYHASGVDSGVHTHLDAQGDFVLSAYEGEKPIAMLIDGSWWYNEAKNDGVFDRLKRLGGDEAELDLRYMPLPKGPDYKPGKFTMLDSHYMLCFANKNTQKRELVEKFIRFCYTDENLKKSSVIMNNPFALNYTIDESQMNSLSSYPKSIWEMRKNADIIHPVSRNDIYIRNQGSLYFNVTFQTEQYKVAVNALIAGQTPKEVFEGIADYYDGLFG